MSPHPKSVLAGLPGYLSVRSNRLRSHVSYLLSATLVFNPLALAAAPQIVVDGRTRTELAINGSVTDVRTETIRGDKAFNSFDRFDVHQGNTVNLHLPGQTEHLFNLVHGHRSNIDGILNSYRSGELGGNVYFANPFGVVIGESGRVNVGSLHLTTPSRDFMDRLMADGGIDDSAVADLMAGQVPVSDDGLISVQGEINALDGVYIKGRDISASGLIRRGALLDSGAVAVSDVVNTGNLEQGAGVRVSGGTIEILAARDLAVSGGVSADASAGRDAGNIDLRAGQDITLAAGARVSAVGEGEASDGGRILAIAKRDAHFESGAAMDVSAGTSGDGGFIELSANRTVNLDGGQFAGRAANGRAGKVYIDPETVNANVLGGGGVDYEVEADVINVAENVVISTRDVAVADGATGAERLAANLNGDSIGDSTNITLRAGTINMAAGSQLLAWANAGYDSGDILLTNLQDDLTANDVSESIAALLGVYNVGASEEARFLARLTNTDSAVSFNLDGATLKGGQVTLEAYASDRFGFQKDASALIALNNTDIQADDLRLDARADTSLLPEIDDNSPLAVTETFVDLQWGFDGSAFYGESDAVADIQIRGDSELNASDTLSLVADANSRANPMSFGANVIPVGGEWSDAMARADITLADSARLIAQGALDLEAKAVSKADADVNNVITSNSVPFNVSFAVVQADTRANIQVGEGTRVEGASATLKADVESDVSSTALAEKRSGSSAGASLAYSDIYNEAGVEIAGAVESTSGAVDIDAGIDSRHSNSSSAASIGGALGTFAKFNNYTTGVQQNALASLLKPVTGKGDSIASAFFPLYKEGKFNLSAAVAVAQEDSFADVEVTGTGRIDSAGNASLDTLISNDTFITASAESTSAGTALGGAVAWSDYNNTATTQVAAGGGVYAQGNLDLQARSLTTDPRDAIVLDPSRPADTLGTLTSDVADLFITSGVFNQSKGSDLGLAAGASIFHSDNTAIASVAGTAEGEDVSVKARAAADIINVAGIIPKISASKTALGGNVNYVEVTTNADALVLDGARIRATGDLTVDAEAEVEAVEVTFAGGRAEKFGLEGAVSIFNANLNSQAAIADLVDLEAGTATVAAANLFDVINAGGAFVASKQGGIGASVALNTVNSDAHAYLGNELATGPVDPARPTLVVDQDLTVKATSDGELESYAFAGVVATGSGGGSSPSSGSSSGSGSGDSGSGGSGGSSGSTGGKKMGIGIAGQASVNRVDADTRAQVNGARVEAGSLTVAADSSGLEIAALAGAVAAAGGKEGAAGIAGGYAQNSIGGDTLAAVNDADILAAAVAVSALGGGTIQALAASVGAAISSKGFGLAGSVTNNTLDGMNTRALVARDSLVRSDTLSVSAGNQGIIRSLAGAVAVAGKVAVGGSVAVNSISGNSVEAAISGDDTDWEGGSAMVSAESEATIETAAVGAAVGGQVALTGSVAVNTLANDVRAEIRDGARVLADGNVGVLAENDDRVSVLAGGVAVGKAVGVGASAVVNRIAGTTTAGILGAGTEVTALGLPGTAGFDVRSGRLVDDQGNTLGAVNQDANVDIDSYGSLDIKPLQQDRTVTGVAVNASSSQHVETLVANVAAGRVGVGVLATVNFIEGSTEARIQDARINTLGSGGPLQDLFIGASNHAYANGFAGVLAGGKAGVGAAADTHFITRDTRAFARGAQLNAARDVEVDAYATQGASSLAVGGAVGAVAVAGTAAVLRFNAETEAFIEGSAVVARNLRVNAEALNALALTAGALAVGGVGVGATFTLGLSENITRAFITGNASGRADLEQVSGDTSVSATSDTRANTIVVGGAAAGAQAIAGMAAVNLMSNQTSASIAQADLGTAASRSGGLSITADDHFTIDNKAGALTIGGSDGIGAGAIVNIIKGGARATLTDSTVFSSADVILKAESARDLSNWAVALSGGGSTGISALVVLTLLGEALSGDAAGEVDQNGSGTLSSLDSVASGNKLDGTGVEEGLEDGDSVADLENRASTSVSAAAYSGNLYSTAAMVDGDTTLDAVNVSVDAIDRTGVDTQADAAGIASVGLGGAAGISLIKTQVESGLGQDASIRASGDVAIRSLAGRLGGDRNTADTRLFAGGGGLVGLGAAVAIADVDNRVTTTVNGTIEGNRTNSVTLAATDEASVDVDADGVAVGAIAVGLVYAKAEKGESDPDGNTLVRTQVGGTGQIRDFASISAASRSSGSVEARARAAAGGVVAGNGAVAEADDDTRVRTVVEDGAVLLADERDSNDNRVGGTINLTADVTPDLDATAEGASIALSYRAGVSLAFANVNASAEVDVAGDNLDTNILNVIARHNLAADGFSVTSRAFGAGGGLLLGLNATRAESSNNVDVVTRLGEGVRINARDSALIQAKGLSAQSSEAIGINGGLIAVGANLAETNVDTQYQSILEDSAIVTGGDVTFSATGVDIARSRAVAGSGGVVSGVASKAQTANSSSTRVQIGAAGALDNIDVASLTLLADHTADFNASTDSTNASLLGASGAFAENVTDALVAVNVAGGARLVADRMDFNVFNRMDKPNYGDFDVVSGSGGVLDAAAARSKTLINNISGISVGDGARLTAGTQADPGHLRMQILNELLAQDAVKLDSGGAISVARAESSVRNPLNQGAIYIGKGAELVAEGDVDLTVRNSTGISTSANAKTYGGAGAAQGQATSDSQVVNSILVAEDASIRSRGDLRMLVGRDAGGNASSFNLIARTDLWNKTVLPIETKPEADARLRQDHEMGIAAGARLETVGDVTLGASGGQRNVSGSGVGKDLYREALAAVGSFFSNLVGGDDISLEIKGGSSSDSGQATARVDGEIHVGTERNRVLVINQDGSINLDQSSEGIDDSFLSLSDEPLVNDLQERKEELEALIADLEGAVAGTPSSGTPELAQELNALEAEKASRINSRAGVEDSIGQVDTLIGYRNQIQTLQGNLSGLDPDDDADQISQIQGQINSLQTSLDSGLADINAGLSPDAGTLTAAQLDGARTNLLDTRTAIDTRLVQIDDRIAVVSAQIIPPDTDTNDLGRALIRYNGELASINFKLDSLQGAQSTRVMAVEKALTARSSSIHINADSLTGSGVLDAPGDTLIEIRNRSRNFLRTNDMTIPDEAGGFLVFNGARVDSVAQINARNRTLFGVPVAGTAAFSEVTTAGNTTPTIRVTNTFSPLGGERAPDIFVDGDITNRNGLIEINNVAGSVLVKGSSASDDGAGITGDTIRIEAGRDIALGYQDGFRHSAGEPKSRWQDVISASEGGGADRALGSVPLANVPRDTEPSQLAGNNVFLAAEFLNINGIVQSGLADRGVTITDAMVNAVQLDPDGDGVTDYTSLAAYRTAWQSGAVDRFIQINAVAAENDKSQIPVLFDAQTNELVVDNTRIAGGSIELYGHIMNTSHGQLKVMDGYGRINVANETGFGVRLRTLDTGRNVDGQVRITDYHLDSAGNLAFNPIVSVIRGSDHADRTAHYDPQANQYYSFTTSGGATWTDNRRLTRERWFGINAGEETSYSGISRFNVLPRQAVGSDVVLLDSSKGGARYWYDNTTSRSYGSWSAVSNDWTKIDDYALYIKDYKDYERSVSERVVHNHNIAADNRIAIDFIGYDTGTLSVTSQGDLRVEGSLNNESGLTSLHSGGHITGFGDAGQVAGRDIGLVAQDGIGAADQALAINLNGGQLDASSSSGDIHLSEVTGDLVYEQVTAAAGTVALSADNSIRGAAPASLISARGVDLTARNGAIGQAGQVVRIDTSGLAGSGLVASAAGDIAITEVSGDLLVRSVISGAGDVTLAAAAGDLVDDNPVAQTDERAEAELLGLWDAMQLTGADSLEAARNHVEAIERRKQREYTRYWQLRQQQPGGAEAFDPDYQVTLDQASRDYLIDEQGLSAAQVADYEAAQTAEYRTLHAAYGDQTDSYDASWQYRIAEGSAEWQALTEGYEWTRSQLENSLNAGILAEVSDTELTIEKANVEARNVSLSALAGQIGSDTGAAPVTINISGRTWSDLSDLEKRLLATAERSDLEFLSDQEVRVTQYDDLDLAAIGSVTGQSAGSIYLGSEGGLTLANVAAGGDVRIKTSQGLSGVDHGQVHVSGNRVLLEAGSQSIGISNQAQADPILLAPLRVDATELTARTGDRLWLESAGDLPVATIYAVNDVVLSVGGILSDALDSAALNIRAASLDLAAQAIGSLGNALDIALDPAGQVTARADAGVYLDSPDRGLDVARIEAGGDVRMFAGGNLRLDSQLGGIASAAGDVDLSAAGDIGYLDSTDQGVVISARNLYLESLGAGVGESAQPLQVDLADRGLLAGAGATGFHVADGSDSLSLGLIEAPVVSLTAAGGLFDGNGDLVNLATSGAILSGGSGAIGAGADGLELAGASPTMVTANATGDVHLVQTQGDLVIAGVTSAAGNVRLAGSDSILGDGLVSGRSLALSAGADIGSLANPLAVEMEAAGGGQLNLQAGGSAHVASTGTLAIGTWVAGLHSLVNGLDDILIGTMTTTTASLASAGRLEAGRLEVAGPATMEARQIQALVSHSGSGPAVLSATGQGAGLAEAINLVVLAAGPLELGRLYAANAQVRHQQGQLSVLDGWVPGRVQFDTPALRLVMDNADPRLEPVDVQLYAEAERFNLFMDGDSVRTNQYALNFRDGIRVISRSGDGESLLTQAEDEDARLGAIINPDVGGELPTLAVPGGANLVSFLLDTPFVNGMEYATTTAGRFETHCESHPYARECRTPNNQILFPIR